MTEGIECADCGKRIGVNEPMIVFSPTRKEGNVYAHKDCFWQGVMDRLIDELRANADIVVLNSRFEESAGEEARMNYHQEGIAENIKLVQDIYYRAQALVEEKPEEAIHFV